MSKSDMEASDSFWSAVTDYGHYGYVYDSIEEMTAAAHLVVRGTIVGFHPGIRYPYGTDFGGPTIGPWDVEYGVVQVLEVLKGEPSWRTFGQIEVASLGWPDMTEDDLPPGEVLLFLMNDSQWREEQGENPNPDDNTVYQYVRPNPYQTALRDINGDIELIEGPEGWQDAFGPFPSELDGTSYEDAAEAVRALQH